MKDHAGGLVIALLVGGCFFPQGTSRTAHTAAYVVDGVVLGLGAVATLGLSDCFRDTAEHPACKAIGLALGTLAVGAIGLGANALMGVDETPEELEREEREERLETVFAWAVRAAHAGDCPTARLVTLQVASIDRETYERLVAEPALRVCLP